MPLATSPTSLQVVLGSYLYSQYSDDDDLQGFVAAQNLYTQSYLDTFNGLNLPIYTQLTGALLDWVGQGLYGISRPGLPSGGSGARGPLATYRYAPGFGAAIGPAYAVYVPPVSPTFTATTDDVYKRILTWALYKGDGKIFNMRWLKRRIYRFLNGANGVDFPIDQTYNVSVAFTGPYAATITLATSTMSTIFQTAVANGVLELPFMISWTVTLV